MTVCSVFYVELCNLQVRFNQDFGTFQMLERSIIHFENGLSCANSGIILVFLIGLIKGHSSFDRFLALYYNDKVERNFVICVKECLVCTSYRVTDTVNFSIIFVKQTNEQLLIFFLRRNWRTEDYSRRKKTRSIIARWLKIVIGGANTMSPKQTLSRYYL
jgi:hypothetical protein